MTLKTIFVALVLAFVMSAAAAVAASAADLMTGPGSRFESACVARAHAVIDQHEATKLVLRRQKQGRPHDLDTLVRVAAELPGDDVIMPEELRARMIAENLAACRS